MGLPSLPPCPYVPVIKEAESDQYIAWYKSLQEEEPEIPKMVKQLIDQTNELEPYTPLIVNVLHHLFMLCFVSLGLKRTLFFKRSVDYVSHGCYYTNMV